MKAPVLRALERLHLLRPTYRAYEALRSATSRDGDVYADDGLPLPPARLRTLVAGTPGPGWFLESGRIAANTIREALARHGVTLDTANRMLDFGCGCGRVIRHFRDLDRVELHGSDYNRELVEWCHRNLPFARFAVNGGAPPTTYEDESFDVVYALSVVTHLPEDRALAWVRELERVLRPAAILILSTHGDRYRERLTSSERAAYDAGRFVVRWESVAGTNLCTTYQPETYVRETLAENFELLEHVPEGAAGNPHQDLVVLRKPARRLA